MYQFASEGAMRNDVLYKNLGAFVESCTTTTDQNRNMQGQSNQEASDAYSHDIVKERSGMLFQWGLISEIYFHSISTVWGFCYLR